MTERNLAKEEADKKQIEAITGHIQRIIDRFGEISDPTGKCKCVRPYGKGMVVFLEKAMASFQTESNCVEDDWHFVLGCSKQLILEEPLSPDDRDLMIEVIRVLYNWNDNFLKNEGLANDLKFVERMYMLTISTVELVSVIRYLTYQIKKFKEQTPSLIDLSMLYLNSLEEKGNDNR